MLSRFDFSLGPRVGRSPETRIAAVDRGRASSSPTWTRPRLLTTFRLSSREREHDAIRAVFGALAAHVVNSVSRRRATRRLRRARFVARGKDLCRRCERPTSAATRGRREQTSLAPDALAPRVGRKCERLSVRVRLWGARVGLERPAVGVRRGRLGSLAWARVPVRRAHRTATPSPKIWRRRPGTPAVSRGRTERSGCRGAEQG